MVGRCPRPYGEFRGTYPSVLTRGVFLNPLITGMLAQGNIKSFEIGLASLYTVNFMASYVCLKLGMPVETVFVLNIVFKALVLVVLLIHSKLKFAFR